MKMKSDTIGQISLFDIFDMTEESEKSQEKEIEPIGCVESGKLRNKGMGEPCEGCDVMWCSLICFQRRGYFWDPVDRFIKDSEGHLLRKPIENRECKTERFDG